MSSKPVSAVTPAATLREQIPLSGWGRYPVARSYVQRPEKISTLTQIIQASQDHAVLARGLGRSYGDAALNPTGCTVMTERLNHMLAFDEQTGTLCCEAGVTIQEILDVFVPRGWFPLVTPGTKFVTIGGTVAADVHGKNHHRDGSFSSCVQSLKLISASGETVQCSRNENSDLFWATTGGMGLTGVITEVELRMQPISTAYMHLHSIKARNLDEAIALFDQYEPQYQYSVAWIDCLASGKALGRSILMLGNHTAITELAPQQQAPLHLKSKHRLKISHDLPTGLLNRYTIGNFNALYYARQRAQHVDSVVDYDSFFYPLDFLQDWNRLYGKRGFIQYQCVFPMDVSRDALVKTLELCSQKGWGSFLAVLKRLGSQPEGWLSFPMPGYTLTLDMPVKSGLWEFLDELDQLVIRYGGRVYLAKDARLSPNSFRAMYPRFPQWLEVKTRVDPHNVFSSALSRRLHIGSTMEPTQA